MNYLECQALLKRFFRDYPGAYEATGCGVGIDGLWIKLPIDHEGEYPDTYEGHKVIIRKDDSVGELC